MVEFRQTPVSDAGAHALLTEYFSDRALSFPVAQGAYRTAFPVPEQFVPPQGVFLLVWDAGAGIGCGGIRRIDDREAAVRYEVKHLWLQPATRGRGWGRALLGELELRARAFGAGEVVLDTNAALTAAGALYRAAGYRSIPPYNDNPNATTWYAKDLT